MSTKINKISSLPGVFGIISLHLFLVFHSVFFLSPEFSLYPYFTNLGLQPYIQIIDQHFPMLFFGPINLSFLGVANPQNLLILFILLVTIVDLLAWFAIQKTKLNPTQKIISLLVFTAIELTFDSQILWIETFVLLFILLGQISPNKLIKGLIWGLAVSVRPNLFPLFVLLLLLEGTSIPQLIMLCLPLAWEFIWVYQNHLWEAFRNLVFTFNTKIYVTEAKLLPSWHEILLVLLVCSLGLITMNSWQSGIWWTLLVLFTIEGVYPRFDLVRILPLAAIWIWWIKSNNKRIYLAGALSIILLTIVIRKNIPFITNNFYYQTKTYEIAQAINLKYSGKHIYYLGGPDQLYILTHATPPGNYYLPSLPWYLSQNQFTDKEINFLRSNRNDYISVNTESRVDGKNLVDYSQPLQRLISSEYVSIDQIGPLVIYRHL